MATAIPVGLNPTAIGVGAAWWLEAARQAESAGFGAAWCWDHFVSRGRRSDPVLECWTTLAAAAAVTSRIRVGSFVTNVMNRHPAVLARMAATVSDLSGGRLELGIGIGGYRAEHLAYGIPFPEATERAVRLEEAVHVLRLLFGGGPVDFEGRFGRLEGAFAFPAPQPPPRIVIAGRTPEGARLAARLGDAWTCFAADLERLMPVYAEALAAAGRERSAVSVLVAVEVDGVVDDLAEAAAAWRERGADELVVHRVQPHRLAALLGAATRATL